MTDWDGVSCLWPRAGGWLYTLTISAVEVAFFSLLQDVPFVFVGFDLQFRGSPEVVVGTLFKIGSGSGSSGSSWTNPSESWDEAPLKWDRFYKCCTLNLATWQHDNHSFYLSIYEINI